MAAVTLVLIAVAGCYGLLLIVGLVVAGVEWLAVRLIVRLIVRLVVRFMLLCWVSR